jgi:hypothetical protein
MLLRSVRKTCSALGSKGGSAKGSSERNCGRTSNDPINVRVFRTDLIDDRLEFLQFFALIECWDEYKTIVIDNIVGVDISLSILIPPSLCDSGVTTFAMKSSLMRVNAES